MKTPGILISALLSLLSVTVSASQFHGSVHEAPEAVHDAWNATLLLDTRCVTTSSQRQVASTGTGIVVAQSGRRESLLVVTSAHVVACRGARVIRARFHRPGETRAGMVWARAHLVWSDERLDLALLETHQPRGTASGIL